MSFIIESSQLAPCALVPTRDLPTPRSRGAGVGGIWPHLFVPTRRRSATRAGTSEVARARRPLAVRYGPSTVRISSAPPATWSRSLPSPVTSRKATQLWPISQMQRASSRTTVGEAWGRSTPWSASWFPKAHPLSKPTLVGRSILGEQLCVTTREAEDLSLEEAVLPGEIQHGDHVAAEPGEVLACIGARLPQRRMGCGVLGEQRADDLLLVAEVVVEVAGAEPGVRGDVIGRHPRGPALVEQPPGRVADALARQLRPSLRPPAAFRVHALSRAKTLRIVPPPQVP